MPLTLETTTIGRIGVLDDQASVREAYAESVEDLEAEPVDYTGPLPDLDALLDQISDECDAVLCDYRLRPTNYAAYNGDSVVAGLLKRKVPAVLCTEYTSCFDEMRARGRYIPSVIRPDELEDLRRVESAFLTCLREAAGIFAPNRRAWRTLARFEGTGGGFAYLVLPSWQPRTGIRVLLSDLPPWLCDALARDETFRCHVWANTGAEPSELLFLDNWERPAV